MSHPFSACSCIHIYLDIPSRFHTCVYVMSSVALRMQIESSRGYQMTNQSIGIIISLDIAVIAQMRQQGRRWLGGATALFGAAFFLPLPRRTLPVGAVLNVSKQHKFNMRRHMQHWYCFGSGSCMTSRGRRRFKSTPTSGWTAS